ncbi:hypothetical protein LX16_2129 [Stackebrandtia albiflava]|uniref:Uncharacterized protein n=1 Tax=Stackebrandtia albiflava TaxID=406432 RepID=A0A562VEW4_9ACTN|nr:hypothetical protein [Stackebrandtia albiflava]TWJ16398.1 hypothetical protein LX16_2129 [Stackebrandtia albiflava]
MSEEKPEVPATDPPPVHWRVKARSHGSRLWRAHWRLVAAWAAVVVLALTTAVQLLPDRAPSHRPESYATYAVVVGIPGLRWGDVDPRNTPTLWELADTGAVASLSVDSASTVTCPLDGWLTLSAGAAASAGTRVGDNGCSGVSPETVEQAPDTASAYVNQLELIANNNRTDEPGVEIGSLPGAVRCATAIGPGAAWGAASPTGRVDRYAATVPEDPDALSALLTECLLSMVDLGRLPEDGSERAEAVAAADAVLARIVAARPVDSLLMVAGLSDVSASPHLHAVIAQGGGFDGGWLTAAGTGREGYLRLIDLAPTVVSALDRPMPSPFAGVPAAVLEGRDSDMASVVAQLTDVDAEAAAQQDAIMRLLTVVAIAGLLLFVAATPILHRIRRGAGQAARRVPTIWTFRAVVSAATALALALPAATLVDFIPWWRASHPMVALMASTVLIVLVLTALVLVAPRRRSPMGLMITVSLVGVVVVGADVLTGARLQFDGIAGYSALNSAGNAGLGPLGLGVFATSLMMAAGCAAQGVTRAYRPLVIVAAGCVGIWIVGSPYLGDDPAGAVGLTVAVCLAAGMAPGGWLTFARLAWASFAGLGLLVALAVADLARDESQRGALGSFVADVFGGAGAGRIRETLEADVLATVGNPLTVLLLGSIVFAWVVLLRPSGGLKRSFGLYPSARAGFVGAIIATLLGGLLGGQGLVPVGAAAAITMPLAVIMAQRVLARAHVRDGRAEPTDLAVQARPESIEAAGGVTVESRG